MNQTDATEEGVEVKNGGRGTEKGKNEETEKAGEEETRMVTNHWTTHRGSGTNSNEFNIIISNSYRSNYR